MNTLYDNLITQFTQKAQIKRDADEVLKVLNNKYPDCSLPNARTFQRFFESKTSNPRDSTLGFMAAYIMDIESKTIETAYKKDQIGAFYNLFIERNKIEKSDSAKIFSPPLHKFKKPNPIYKYLLEFGAIFSLMMIFYSVILILVFSHSYESFKTPPTHFFY